MRARYLAAALIVAAAFSHDTPHAVAGGRPEREQADRAWEGTVTWPGGKRRPFELVGYPTNGVLPAFPVRFTKRQCDRGTFWVSQFYPVPWAAVPWRADGSFRGTRTVGLTGIRVHWTLRGRVTDAGGSGTIRVAGWYVSPRDDRSRLNYCGPLTLRWRVGPAQMLDE